MALVQTSPYSYLMVMQRRGKGRGSWGARNPYPPPLQAFFKRNTYNIQVTKTGEYPLYATMWPTPPPPPFEKSWLCPCVDRVVEKSQNDHLLGYKKGTCNSSTPLNQVLKIPYWNREHPINGNVTPWQKTAYIVKQSYIIFVTFRA